MVDLRNVFRNKNVMVTGGLGFIGSNLARYLVEYGANVLLVDSLIPDYGGNMANVEDIKDVVRINIADVRTRSTMNHLVQGQDYIFNLAGQVSHIDSMADPYTDLEINCHSQLSILEACRNNNPTVKVVFASTRQIYGVPEYLPVDERHLLRPTDVNGINKMAGEWYHIVYNNVYGIKATSLRLTNTYGPRQLVKHNRQGFVGWLIRQAIDGEEIKIFGTGQQRRDFTYVDDAVLAFLLAASSDDVNGQVYNLGGPEIVSLLQFVEMLIDLCPQASYRVVPFPEDRKRIDIGDYYGSFEKIKETLGWEPVVGLREGLSRTVEYLLANKERYWT
ncbi:MAG: NAD-dependent epimerase/dehydratase family protein [Chloroflexi bacterium]|nr:NAD-dependent epimerase/dehydratase family protein [Chloroflexota bacterium]